MKKYVMALLLAAAALGGYTLLTRNPSAGVSPPRETAGSTGEVKISKIEEKSGLRPVRNDPNPLTSAGKRKARPSLVNANLGVHLATEARLIEGDAVSTTVAEDMLGSRQFNRSVDQLGLEMATSPEAQDLTSLYKIQIEKQLAATAPDTRLVGFACGTSLCIGLMRNESDTAYRAWSDLFFSSKATPNFNLMDMSVPVGRNVLEHRFIFSMDREVNAIKVPLERPRS